MASVSAFALILVGCTVEIEPTDLSAVSLENDREIIEDTLGDSIEAVDVRDMTVSAYAYDLGFSEPPSNPLSSRPERIDPYLLLFALMIAPAVHAHKKSKATSQQRRYMAAVFDASNQLLFAGTRAKSEVTNATLTDLGNRYAAAQSGNADALYELGKIALIPQQKKELFERAVAKGHHPSYSMTALPPIKVVDAPMSGIGG